MSKILAGSYLAFILLIVIFSYVFIDANLFYLKSLYGFFHIDNRVLITFFYSVFIIIFFGFYLRFLYLSKKNLLHLKDIKIVIVVSCLLLLSYPAMLSYDIFNYVLTAKVTYFYHENPYVILPIEFIKEPMLMFTHAANKIALYGPFWILLIFMPFSLGFGNFLLTLFMFKFLVFIFYILSLLLILKMTKSKEALVFFALNPLVLIETLVSGHNDIVMMSLALLGLYILLKNRVVFSFVFFLASILIKYATVFLIPLYFFLVYRRLKNKKIEIEAIGLLGFILMMIVFFLSPLREEIYPWYAIWFLLFASLVVRKRFIYIISITLSFGLMFHYIPFMLLGTYFGITPILKIILIFVPSVIFVITKIIKKNI